ncbi:hypothetical protein K1T44_0174 [Listeria innocua]|uniref:Lin2910 protein n=5 Tax=Listeria innocua TaxID=1642 RepID=Q926Y0_LISIN|nr:hypothetical protein HMPREF0557_02800 [Listeria innocua ATCC 33091]UNB89303.1 hypothetical protein K1T44_0174 [Listeria innocua]CAC98135.1 lin2910 [Listeria innocua Clip11262]SPX82670.1 Uncharacterized membrane-bound protein conserved in bacteria [Listeria innocua]
MREDLALTTEMNKPPVADLKASLTKRNLQYVMEVEKHLRGTHYDEEQQEIIIYEMCEKILAEQKKGITARKLFNLTPTEYVVSLDVKAAPVEQNTDKWWLVLDGGLLVLGAMMLISGISAYFQKNAQTLGIIVLVITAVVGGFAMLILRKYASNMRAGQKGGTIKYLLVAVGVIAVWMFVMTIVQVTIPPNINVALSPIVNTVGGAIIIALRFYVKKKKNIPSL